MEKIKVGLVGGGFMAKAHSIAYAGMPMFFGRLQLFLIKKLLLTSMKKLQKTQQYGSVLKNMQQTGMKSSMTLKFQ